jgi:hypothetical protein
MGVLTLIKNYRKLGHKEFMRRWRQGIKELSPLDLIKVQLGSYIGFIFFMTLSIVIFFWRGIWYLGAAFIFIVILNVTQLIEKYQQYQTLKVVHAKYGNLNEIIGGSSGGG